MSGKFTHYLVTRFNVNIKGNGPEWISSASRPIHWEEKRLLLFETICVPSVLGQTCHDFTWLIYSDTHTAEPVRNRIQSATKNIPFVEIHSVDGFDQLLEHLRFRCTQSPTPYVITSRLDNDDAIGRRYIETIQSNFFRQDGVVLNLLGGVNYHLSRKLMTRLRFKEHNHFISLIEEKKEVKPLFTILGFSHLHPLPTLVITNVELKDAFWITLHDQNAAPRKNRGWPVFNATIAINYSIDPSRTPVSWRNTILYTLGWMPGAIYRKVRFKSQQLIKRFTRRG